MLCEMPATRRHFNYMNLRHANAIFQILAGIASIVGLVVVFVSQDPIKGWIALSAVILFLAYITFLVTRTLNHLVKQKYPDGYTRLATHVRYTCIDGKTIDYEIQKIIQSKAPCLFNVKHGFKWSGSEYPKITCSLHEIGAVREGATKSEFDTVTIQLKDALLYNQVGVIPIKITMDDSNGKSGTFVSHKVEAPTQVISWRVELGGILDRSHAQARLTRRPITTELVVEWELIRTVPYHPIHRCYEEQILYPEAGYFYRLTWDRI